MRHVLDDKGWKDGGFKGHWSGIELGLNNYLNKDYSLSLNSNEEFMSLDASRSMDFNLNFVQHSFGILGNRFGLVTGLGFEFNNYFFRHNNSINTDAQGNIVSRMYYDNNNNEINLEKTKLTMTFLTVPVLFEFQFPGALSHSHRVRMAVGVIGGLKLGSHTKVVYEQSGDKKKDKNHDDFSINPFRYGFTARVGYKRINIFSNFYPVSLFEKETFLISRWLRTRMYVLRPFLLFLSRLGITPNLLTLSSLILDSPCYRWLRGRSGR